MKERPILFSAPMVRAILDGRKTVTRRIVKTGNDMMSGAPRCIACTMCDDGFGFHSEDEFYRCPYGQPGDRLWVRETHMIHGGEIAYAATDQPLVGCDKWKPSIFMPRCASRITLEIIGVRVERLQNITDDEALSEGVANARQRESTWYEGKAVGMFRDLWLKINGVESWRDNPWVWVVEFKKMNSP